MLPQWDIDANLPMIHKTYTMHDMLTDDEMLRLTENGDQVLVYTKRQPLDAICLGDHLVLDDGSFRISENISAVRFDIPEYLDQGVAVSTLFPTLRQGTQVVPQLRNELALAVEIDAREYFEEMTFSRGRLLLFFTNKLSIPLRLEHIRLLSTTGAVIAQSSYNGLVQPGAEISLPHVLLDGMTLNSLMRLAFDVSTPGSNEAVDISGSMYLGIKGRIEQTEISSVRGCIPAQHFQVQNEIDMPGAVGMRIREALVKHGAVHLVVTNHFNLAASITVTLPNAMRDASPLRATTTVQANSSKSLSIDLSNAVLTPRNETMLLFESSVSTEDAGSRVVTITATDNVSIDGEFERVAFTTMTGNYSPGTIAIRSMQVSDFGLDKSVAASLQLHDVRMWASLRNQASLPLGMNDVSILGRSRSGSSASLNVQAMDIGGRSDKTVQFDNTHVTSFFNSFKPAFPDSLGMKGKFLLNPDKQYGSLHASDSILGDVHVEFPLRFTQVSASITDTVKLVIDESSRRKMTDVNEGTFTFSIENHLPASVTIEPVFLDERYKPLLSPTSTSGDAPYVAAAPVDVNGFVARSITESINLHFSGQDFAAISRAAWVQFRISFDSKQQSGATFRSTDYVRVRGYARLNISSTITEK